MPTQVYFITTQTSDREGAGTDATVYFTLIGTKGASSELCTNGAPWKRVAATIWRTDVPVRFETGDAFERGAKDEFTLACEDLGVLQKIRIRHDNTGHKPGWHLHSLTVSYNDITHRPHLFRTYTAKVNQWFAKDEGDGLIDRTFDLTPI